MRQQLEETYRSHRQGLFAMALSVTRCAQLAEDAIHVAFERLCRQKKQPICLRRWLKTRRKRLPESRLVTPANLDGLAVFLLMITTRKCQNNLASMPRSRLVPPSLILT